ncbi:uncharacterized protein LOC129892860 [Solanum dulcamara]|uniref:uncharacterized protein LOC129892860 n=1 Tax=Solanum dulcamara TaxID=45834 RepID=UPI0024862E85|nr:uncharacterized protein LOC129892860 [Solanum dulcamara]
MDSSRNERTLFQISLESSVGQSSRFYYYRRGEGVPFEWEKLPGIPKINPSKDDVNNIINTPLSPPPSFQSLGLPKPCFDDHESKRFKVWLTKKMKKLHPLKTHDGATSFNNSSSSSFDSNTKERARDLMEDPHCCNLTSMDKEDFYSKMHKRVLSEEIGEALFLDRIVSRMSSVDQSYYRSTEGIPFKWEMKPGTPIHIPQNEGIPPPSPPPIVQSLALPKPCIPHHDQDNTLSTWDRIKRMIKSSHHAGRDSVLSSLSSSISKKKVLPLSKFRRDVLGRTFCFNPWKIRANLPSSRRI